MKDFILSGVQWFTGVSKQAIDPLTISGSRDTRGTVTYLLPQSRCYEIFEQVDRERH